MSEVRGRRVYPNAEGRLFLSEGDYGKDADGWWNVRPPSSGAGFITGPKSGAGDWQVTEHEDGTITASPSIDTGSWHGHLRAGVWVE
jgi:hypothetical protein